MLGRDHIALEMGYGFPGSRFSRMAAPPDLTHEHGALYRGNAKVGHALFVGALAKSSLGFLFDEECRQLILYHFKDQAEVLAGQLVVFSHLVSHGSEGTTASHLKALL